METLSILEHTLANIKEFANTDISEESFQKTIGELKATMHQLRARIPGREQLSQLEDIIHFKVMSQRSHLEQALTRSLASNKYGRWGLGWNRKGKYVYDLDQLELKLEGLIYKIEKEQPN